MKISEIFFSVQGEGISIGLPTIFIRLFGCNLDCAWCDTGYAKGTSSQEVSDGDWREMSVEEILEAVQTYPCKRVCVTGGEPLLQEEVYELISQLIKKKYRLSVETNGSFSIEKLASLPLSLAMDIKTPSSGMVERMNFRNIPLLRKRDMLKFVIAGEEDFEYAHAMLRKSPSHATVIFTTVGGKELRWLVEKVLGTGLDVRVLPQLHKFVFQGKEKGV